MSTSNQKKRRQQPESEWRQLIQHQESSGVGVPEFCLMEGISDGSFYVWRKRFLGDTSVNELNFNRIEIKSAVRRPDVGLKVFISGGLELHFTELLSVDWILGLSKSLSGG
jgi:hypothetical protein